MSLEASDVTDLLKHIRRWLLGGGPDGIDARAERLVEALRQEAIGLKSDLRKITENEDDPFDALMRNFEKVGGCSRRTHH